MKKGGKRDLECCCVIDCMGIGRLYQLYVKVAVEGREISRTILNGEERSEETVVKKVAGK